MRDAHRLGNKLTSFVTSFHQHHNFTNKIIMLKLDILVHPSYSEPALPEPERKPTSGKKWRFPWRINMLAAPRPPVRKKYEAPPPQAFKIFQALEPATEFRCNHLALPLLRTLCVNKDTFKERGPEYITKVIRNLNKAWNSIYNYYKKTLRDRRLHREKRRLARLQAKKPQGKSLENIEAERKETILKLATPKKLFRPEPIPRKWMALEDLLPLLETLAAPKEYHIVPPREVGRVNSKALLYEITEAVLKLSQLPERMKKRHSEPLIPGHVKRGALLAKCSERVEKLAQPSFSAREAKKHEEDKYDPWVISPNALKYKPSPRILELSKPLERK